MDKSLNFNTAPKRFLNVTLADDKNTTLMVEMPTKSIMRQLFAVQGQMEGAGAGKISMGLLDDIYAVCAAALSRNKAGVVISQDYLEELFDFDDILLFFGAYSEFVGEAASAHN